jgi:hypothetical protein
MEEKETKVQKSEGVTSFPAEGGAEIEEPINYSFNSIMRTIAEGVHEPDDDHPRCAL